MLVCVLGTLFNLANILVLTHRDMRNPVNMILTGMAVADFLNNFEYIPFTAHMNLLDTEARSIEDEVIIVVVSSKKCNFLLAGFQQSVMFILSKQIGIWAI